MKTYPSQPGVVTVLVFRARARARKNVYVNGFRIGLVYSQLPLA